MILTLVPKKRSYRKEYTNLKVLSLTIQKLWPILTGATDRQDKVCIAPPPSPIYRYGSKKNFLYFCRKQLIDEDKRELLRFQEMYLADGDLHSEGGGRIRRFRWNNMGKK